MAASGTPPSDPTNKIEMPSKEISGKQSNKWMEGQSNVLDEVDQLVELMSVEKKTMSKKISTLEVRMKEVVDSKNELESSNHRLLSENSAMKEQLRSFQEKSAGDTRSLTEALELALKQLAEVRAKVTSLTFGLEQKEKACTELQGDNLKLKQTLKTAQGDYRTTCTELEVQRSENSKLISQLSTLRSQCKLSHTEKCFLASKLEDLQRKHKYSQDEVLALKGRITSGRKMQDQLKAKCSTLEKAVEAANSKSPTVIRVPNTARSREELRLLAECKKKDEVLASYSKEMSTKQNLVNRQHKQICKLEEALLAEHEERKTLLSKLQAKRRESDTSHDMLQTKLKASLEKIQAYETKELEYSTISAELRDKMSLIDDELRLVREEMALVKIEVEGKEVRWREEKIWMEEEKEQAKELIKASRNMIERLSSELEVTRQQHLTLVEGASKQWEVQLREAKDDYRRLKEASTRRCTELAKEVWELKSKLGESES